MKYDIINAGETEDDETPEFFTIGNLIELCLEHPEKNFRFLGTDYTVGSLMSWRGSYNLPAIDYDLVPSGGKEIAEDLLDSLKMEHYGWKGGEYKYARSDQFYISERGRCEEYKVCGYRIQDGEVVLLTKLDPY